jgi:adenine phosphoribosyltransferase
VPDRASQRRRGPINLDHLLRARVRDVLDYPRSGIVFKDITPLLADQVAFGGVVDAIVAAWGRGTVDKVVGIEARGFILAAPVAYHIGAGFVPVRKSGKLPTETLEEKYDLEYGTASIEVHQDAFRSGDRVLIVDDVLATGGTAAATVELVQRAGGDVIGLSVLLELVALGGRARLEQREIPLHAVLSV